MRCSRNGSVCLVCCVFDSVCESLVTGNGSGCLVCCVSDSVCGLFGEIICNIFLVWLLFCC